LAQTYLAVKDSEKAAAEATSAIQEESKRQPPRTMVLLSSRTLAARIFEERGEFAKTVEQTDSILKIAPNDADARYLRDRALISLNQPDQAQPDLEALAAAYEKANNPQLVRQYNQIRLLLGDVYFRRRDYAKASALFEQVWKTGEAGGFLALQKVKVAQGKAPEAARELEELAQKNPNVAALRFELANLDTAAAQQTVRSDPNQAKAFLQKATDNYKEVLKTNPNADPVWFALAQTQLALGQTDAAIGSLEQVERVAPNRAQSFVLHGVVLGMLGRTKEAADLYNKALGLDPQNPQALNNLAFIEAESGANLDQAMTYAEKAKQEQPKNPDVSDTLGYVYFRKNLNAEALRIFQQNVADNPTNSTYHLHLAMALSKQGNKQAAKDEAQKALKSARPTDEQKIRSFLSQLG
jgi:tetratricopeptide (TPR) repeat protein